MEVVAGLLALGISLSVVRTHISVLTYIFYNVLCLQYGIKYRLVIEYDSKELSSVRNHTKVVFLISVKRF